MSENACGKPTGNSPEGKACNLVLNISIGLMTVALRVLAKLPAIRGAGVKLAVNDASLPCARFKLEALAAGSDVPVKMGETTVRRYSYPSM
jgi:hypothetical protein